MKKYCLLFIALIAFVFSSIAQSSVLFSLIVINEDGDKEFVGIKQGDKLVYEVNAGGNRYDFIITVNDMDSETGIDFNYEMTNSSNTKGHVNVSADARAKATKYVNYFKGGDLNLTDACTVWLSDKNFNDMPERKTTIQLDNTAAETFYRPKDDEVSPVVKIKGENKTIDGFRINNAADGNGNKTLWIHNDSSNSLILKMELGWSIVLKEIR